jgi:hypothetical protein
LAASRSNPKMNKEDRSKPVRVSRTDPEARKTKMADGGIRPAYNGRLRGAHEQRRDRGRGGGEQAGGQSTERAVA